VRAVQRLLDVDGAELGRLAEAQPLLLDRSHVEEALTELRNLMGLSAPAAAMALRRDPGAMLRVQRGQRRLGVNPDEM
jgi:hypothetical protein